MRKSEFFMERDKDLYESYIAALGRKDVHSHKDAIRAAIHSPTKRCWISTYQAYRELLRMKKGKPPREHTIPKRLKLLEHIYERYKKLKEKPTFRGCSTYFITPFVLQEPAPEFYLSYSRALVIITKYKKNMRHAERLKKI